MNIKQYINETFSGVVSIRKNGSIMFEEPFGYADRSNEIKNGVDTLFPAASAGKVFIAVAILKLIEENKINIDTEIGNILSFNLEKINPHITIKQLLTHTSGIPDYCNENIIKDYAELWKDYPNYKIRKSTDLLPLFIHESMMYNPGEKFQYNNSGFVILGIIIEEITKKLFDKYLEEEIFTKCGMNSTGYYELDRLPRKCANAYIYDKEKQEYYTNIYSVDVKGTGAGGAFTTVSDVYNFWKALLNNKIISKNMFKRCFKCKVMMDHHIMDMEYGLKRKLRINISHIFKAQIPE